ncbi:DUF3987 domain-containing protein [Ottowia sp. VDI28]|uniref:DUF3987 domain-containing protein n=1 Tax=Ottowia sp. VDI28 TaxID=3133968 RepID=UPI003C2CC067
MTANHLTMDASELMSLYGAQGLADSPSRQVVVFGDRVAAAAAEKVIDAMGYRLVVVAPPGDPGTYDLTTWSILAGRKIAVLAPPGWVEVIAGRIVDVASSLKIVPVDDAEWRNGVDVVDGVDPVELIRSRGEWLKPKPAAKSDMAQEPKTGTANNGDAELEQPASATVTPSAPLVPATMPPLTDEPEVNEPTLVDVAPAPLSALAVRTDAPTAPMPRTAGMNAEDYVALMEPVARLLLGNLNESMSKPGKELRFGSHGSMSVDLEKGVWSDHELGNGGGVLALIVHCGKAHDLAEAACWIEAQGLRHSGSATTLARSAEPAKPKGKASFKIVAQYPYFDADGVEQYEVCRLDPKGFRQRRPDPSARGGWSWDVKGITQVPYRLPSLLAASLDTMVFIPEGEKDANTLAAHQLVATCNAGGAGKWADSLTQHLIGRRVILLPDNDDAGRNHVRLVASKLLSVAFEVRILDLAEHWPEMPHKGDVSDWFAAGGTAEELQRLAMDARMVDAAAAAKEQAAAEDVGAHKAQFSKAAPVWGEPVDLFNVTPVSQIPLDVLPEPIARFAADQAELMGCDHSVVAMAALAAAASCIHDGIQIQPKRHDPYWTESARLWVAVIGSPSTKKSPAISKAVHPVKAIDRARRENSESERAKWAAQHAERKDEKKKDRDAPEPKAPPTLRALVEDITIEALGEVLKDNPQGVLVVRDEITGWLGSMDAYRGGAKGSGGKDRADWLELYNGGPRPIDRITRGNVFVPNWSACLVGGIQPDMMRRVAANMGNDGLLQRFIPVVARSMGNTGVDRPPDMQAVERFRELFKQLVAIQPSQHSVKLSEQAHQARERIDAYAARMAQAIAHNGMEAWLGKWSGLFARLLLTFHVIECAEEHVYPTDRMVSGKTAEKVERLMCGTLLRHAVAFYGEIIDQHDRQESARELARLILARGWTIVRKRDLQRNWKAAAKMEAWQLHDVINRLCDMAWLDPDREDGPGPDGKPRTWFVNPAVHKAFAVHAEQERTRRAEVVETLRELKAAYADDKQASGMGASRP